MPSLINCATASNASSTSSSTFDASPRATTAEPSTSSPPFISQVPSSGCAECRFDLLPESWPTDSWKILIYPLLAGRRIFHEEVAVQRAADRLHPAASGRGDDG